MSQVDDLEAQFLEGARNGLGLDAAQTEQRLAALQRALAAGAAPSPSSLPKAPAGGKAAFVKAVGTWSVVGALVGGGLGFAAGYRVASSPGADTELRKAAVLEARALVPPPSISPKPAASEAEPAPASGPEVRTTLPRRIEAAPPAFVGPSDESPEADDAVEGLQEELSYLRRAQNALGSGDAQLALGLVSTLDERVPSGKMLPEREVTRILSLCALERRDEAAERGRMFLERYGKTMYAERVRRSCAVKNVETEAEPTKH